MKSNTNEHRYVPAAMVFPALIVGNKLAPALIHILFHTGIVMTALGCGVATAMTFVGFNAMAGVPRAKGWLLAALGTLSALLALTLSLFEN